MIDDFFFFFENTGYYIMCTEPKPTNPNDITVLYTCLTRPIPKGGLISEGFSLWLKPQKKKRGQITALS